MDRLDFSITDNVAAYTGPNCTDLGSHGKRHRYLRPVRNSTSCLSFGPRMSSRRTDCDQITTDRQSFSSC